MVAKPLCPLYKNIIKPLDRARYPELRYKVKNDSSIVLIDSFGNEPSAKNVKLYVLKKKV